MARIGTAGNSIRLTYRFHVNGVLYDPFYVGPIKIYTELVGGVVIDTLVLTHESVGVYQVLYNIPSDLDAGTYYDELQWRAEDGMAIMTQRYSFDVLENPSATVEGTSEVVVTVDVVCRTRPSWINIIGLEHTEDIGNGMGVGLIWRDAEPGDYNNTVHYNIYKASTRFGVFDSWPIAITLDTKAVVAIDPGNQNYFAVRATEFNTRDYDISELTEIGDGLYEYPAEQTLQAEIDAYGVTITIEDASGFPLKGYVQVDYEVMYYSSRTSTSLIVPIGYRGAYQTPVEEHLIGASVRLFKGIEEQNSRIECVTATWNKEFGPPRNVDAVGEFNVAEDGYRENEVDIVNTDLSASDENTADFPNYDYCGYHRPSMQTYFKGGCINSYAWGTLNGQRGVGLQDQNLSRLDAMLQTTGEPVVLLRRKHTGRRCRCLDLRHEHPQARCEYCLGTGFEPPYDRYVNQRAISEFSTNTQGMIMVRVEPYKDDVKLDPANGLMQDVELSAWTINLPTIRDRDIVIRFDEEGVEEFRYECLNVTRNKLILNLTGSQKMLLKRIDKTSIIYTYDWVI